MNKFAERLKELRTEKNLRQEDLGKILNVNQRTISNWEKAIHEPDYDMLIKICEYFDVSLDYLFGITD